MNVKNAITLLYLNNMLSTENYQKLRERIIETCLDLKEDENKKTELWDAIAEKSTGIWNKLNRNDWSYANNVVFESPITLSHVLRVMSSLGIVARVDVKGHIDVSPFKGDTIWNLEKDDLTLQSDETKTFLYELLK